MSREVCNTCQRPIKFCYCDSLVEIANLTHVVIIQHPSEVKHPFNTGRIANLCLSNCELIIAEKIESQMFEKICQPGTQLLYPALEWLSESDIFTENSPPLQESRSYASQLIVIDATWRKSKKILHLNPFLQHLPRLSLRPAYESQYQIRHSSFKDSLSTIESIALALEQLEPETNYKALLKPFQRMIELQTQFSNPKYRERKTKNIN